MKILNNAVDALCEEEDPQALFIRGFLDGQSGLEKSQNYYNDDCYLDGYNFSENWTDE